MSFQIGEVERVERSGQVDGRRNRPEDPETFGTSGSWAGFILASGPSKTIPTLVSVRRRSESAKGKGISNNPMIHPSGHRTRCILLK